jgi:glutathione S-transferase
MLPTFEGELVLFGSSTSPFVRKVRVALLEKALAHRFELTPPWSPTSGIEQRNPLRKVPALGLSDGTHLIDSRVIIQYLEARQPDPPLLPGSPAERIGALHIEALADGIGEAVALWTQEGWRSPEARSRFWLDRHQAKVAHGIVVLEQHIEPWLPALGEPLTLVPIAVGAALGFASFWMPDLLWRNTAPRLGVLADRLAAREAWRQTAPFLAPGATFPRLTGGS